MKKLSIVLVVVLCLSSMAFAKTEVSVSWSEYEGLTQEYALELEAAFEEAHPDIDLNIMSTPWDLVHDKLITSLAAGEAPDVAVIPTRWILEFMDMDVVEPIEQHLSEELMNNIPESIMEGKIKGVLYGLPVAIGPRIFFYRSDLIETPPETFEEMLEIAKEIHSEDVYGLSFGGKKHAELTDFAYYLFGFGGDFFEVAADGGYGKSAVNSEAGVKALDFMYQLTNVDKVTQPSFLSDARQQALEIFVAGKSAMVMSGGFAASMLEQRNVEFEWTPALIPYAEGQSRAPLFVTDVIAMFNTSKNKEGAAKFLEFFYQDEWRVKFDNLVGFPPVTKSLGSHPDFQAPEYQAMVNSMEGSKGWPLIAEWPECTEYIWNAVTAVLMGEKDAKTALDEAAAEIDALRGVE